MHVGTNNAEKEGTSAIVYKCRRLVKTLKEARIGQIVLSEILPVMGVRGVKSIFAIVHIHQSHQPVAHLQMMANII